MTQQAYANPEIAELNQMRLDRDLTLEALAELIAAANPGVDPVDASTLHRLFNNPEREPFDRTLHKIRRFLDAQRKPTRKGR
jgi:hypothetical protein